MKINFDINQANYKNSGIGVYESKIAERLSEKSGMIVHGCANMKRNFKYNFYKGFSFPVTVSPLLYNYVYKKTMSFLL